MWPSGKATGFDPVMRRFESYHPSQINMSNGTIDIFSGSSCIDLSDEVAKLLNNELSSIELGTFSDGEIQVEINENVRGHDTFIIQSTCFPADKHLMELMLLADALKRSSASKITAVVPYYGYARQDRRVRSSRVPISAKVVSDMFSSVGINRVLTLDLHSETIQGFFDMPADNVYATKLMVEDISKHYSKDNLVIVSPDVGGVVRSRALAKYLDGLDLAIIDKRRDVANESEVMNIIGDVAGKECIVPDDIIDTAGTLCNAAKALKDAGASKVSAYITHPVLSGPAIEILDNALKEKQIMLDDILKDRGFPKELINLSHFLKINISSSFSDDEKKDLDFLLWNWNGKIKKFFYPYLHQLNQIFNETDKHEINGLKKRFRIK